MSNFSIKLTSDFIVEEDSNDKYQYGIIKIDDFQEKFLSSLSFWSSDDYIKHWFCSLKNLGANSKSGLIIDMYDPKKAEIIEWWILYKVNNLVYLQNSLLFSNKLNNVFDLECISEYVPERQTQTSEGDWISEWCISISSIENFIANNLFI